MISFNSSSSWSAVHRYSHWIALPLALVMGWAGVAKALDPRAFVQAIENFHVVSGAPAIVLAYYVPWMEIAMACGLLFPQWRKEAAFMTLGFLLSATALLISAQWRGLDVSCGCFGKSNALHAIAYHWLYMRNGILVTAAVLLMRGRIN